MSGYVIERVIMVKRFETHVPYYLGMLVSGPKGGLYYLDEFCTEMALKERFGPNRLTYRTRDIMEHLGMRMGNILVLNEADMIDDILKGLGVTKLIRLKGKEKAKTIGKSLIVDFREF